MLSTLMVLQKEIVDISIYYILVYDVHCQIHIFQLNTIITTLDLYSHCDFDRFEINIIQQMLFSSGLWPCSMCFSDSTGHKPFGRMINYCMWFGIVNVSVISRLCSFPTLSKTHLIHLSF